MVEISNAWLDAWRPRDNRGVAAWAADNVTVPGAARSAGAFNPDYSPWLTKGPIADFGDPSIREQVVLMPTGAGKTTVFDCAVPYIIAETPGDVLMLMQTDQDAKEHMETRALPTLRECPPLVSMFASMDRHSIRKDAIIMPHANFYCRGANKSNVQRISVVYVLIDEAWTVKHGLIEEARARTHARWNRRNIIVSQGGDESILLHDKRIDTELHAAWKRTDRREFSMVCPECSTVTEWDQKHLQWEDAETHDGEPDESIISASTRYVCPKCLTRFEDVPTVRRQLCNESIYVPTNPKPWIDARGGRYVGYHAHGLAIPHEAWGDYAVNWKRAAAAKRAGDSEPMKIIVTKRHARFWAEDEDAPDVCLGASGYVKADYATGELWDGEIHRCMTQDRQRDHRWVTIRAFRPTGESRLLWEGKILTKEAARDLQKAYKVPDWFTFEDGQYETAQVYDECAQYGWIALHGSGDDGFMHHPKNGRPIKKFYSPLKDAQAPQGGRARYIFWSNEKVKDKLSQYRAGRGPGWQAPDDVSLDYRKQIVSEIKRPVVNKQTKQTTERWVKRSSKVDNHLWDCEAMAIVFALIKGLVSSVDVTIDREAEEASTE